jgi:uncharacterized protein YbjT (DUF2867 family)
MPVMVTGAETSLGRATVRALRRTGGEIRGYLDAEAAGEAEAEALRRLGVKAAVGTLDDEGHLELALEQVHTVVHCWGGPLTAPGEELDALAGVLSAALGAGCRRFVWASHLGADAPRGVAYLEACAQAEALLADATLESIVVRRSLTYGAGDELTRRLAAGGAAAVRPTARHAPLALDDLARALAQADRMERSAARSELSLAVELAGPVTLPFGEVVAALRAAGLGGGPPDPLPGSTVALYDRDLEPGPAALGREGTTLERASGALHTG